MWAAVASWVAWSNKSKVALLEEEQAELRVSYEDKVKALTRRLVGVASHGILEQEGLSGRLADIISRQVELENRQSALTAMADRAGGGPAPAPVSPRPDAPANGGSVRTGPSPVTARPGGAEPPLPRSGATGRPEASPGGLGPRSSLDDLPAMPLREQFAAIEGSMSWLESAQIRYLGSLSARTGNGISLIRASLATLGLPLGTENVRQVSMQRAPARSAALDSFQAKVASLEGELAQLERWRSLLDTVPVRTPMEAEGNLTSNFGSRKDPFTGATAMHAGIDFRGPVGTPVKATAAGRVITADVTGGYGNLVEVEHGNGLVTRYAHLSAFNVSSGQAVAPGTVVGLLGSTGRSTGPHLHYETRVNGGAVDPMRFLHAGAQIFDHPPPVDVDPNSAEEATFD